MILKWLLISIIGGVAIAQEYKGCFKSSDDQPDLPNLAINHAVPIADCVSKCASEYYMYAGLMDNGQRCYCGSKFGRNGLSSACQQSCINDTVAFCGTHDSISVYETGVKGPSPPRRIRLTRVDSETLNVTWEPPDIPNGELISYNLKAVAIEKFYNGILPPVDSQVQGGSSNWTTLRGLQPGTKYNVSISAVNTFGTGSEGFASNWTSIGPPSKPETPKIVSKTDTTVTVDLAEGFSESGPVSYYQVVVVRAGTIPPTSNDQSYPRWDDSTKEGLGYYVTGKFDKGDYQRYKRFVVGDGRLVGGFYNAPLDLKQAMPRIGLVVSSEMRGERLFSYSDLTSNTIAKRISESGGFDPTVIGLCVAIGLLGVLLLVSILGYFALRRRHEKGQMRRLPEQQELTLQGPVCEVDNMAYIPEDVPERTNHYQDLKNRVWSIPKNFLIIDAVVIRRGRFGSVHMGTVQINGVPTTSTVHSISDGLLRASEKRAMLRELDVCIRAGVDKNLAGLIGTCETPDTLYVVMEMPPQTLKNRLLAARSGDPFLPSQILSVSVSVASALLYLEGHKILHSCLCARSVGVQSDGSAKLMGHGIAKYSLEDVKYIRWTAVELLNNEKKHQPGVVWAFGVLLWEIFSMGGTPYGNLHGDDDVEDAVRRGVRLPQLRDIPDPFYEVMLSCWQPNREERPTFDELVRLDTLSVCPITAITEPYIPELELN